jgi:hypothetical protein
MYRRANKNILLAGLVLLCSLFVSAQVNVRAIVNRDKILIGEPISLVVETYMPLGTDFRWFNSDSIPFFQITERSAIDTLENMDGKKISQTLMITSFDSGTQYVPPFEIVVNNQPFFTDSIAVQVSFTPFDVNADYRDIKDIIEVVNKNTRYIPWFIAALAFLSAAVLIALFVTRKRTRAAIVAPIGPLLSPYQEAMKSLTELKKRGTRDSSVKEFYSELNDVLRKYILREFGIATFERTNEELIMQLRTLHLSKDSYARLAQSLRMSDFVKFAKYTPAEKDNDDNLEIVRTSIELLNKRLPSAV